MALTAATCIEHARFTLGGANAETPTHLPALMIVNLAGEELCSSRTWRWLEGASAALDFTAGQNYAELPPDFRDVVSLNPTQGRISGFEWTSSKGMVELRTAEFVNGAFYYWGYVTHRRLATGGGAPTPVLEVYPTPTTSTAGANILTLNYRAGWAKVSADETLLTLPSWVEALFLDYVVAFARGYMEEDTASLSQRVQAVQQGQLYANAVRRDGEFQPEMGVLNNGAAQPSYASNRFRNESTVGGPS
ncbi:MAG: hypothetical protein OSB57_01755 [Planctomycetota bacterium]|jgi:hypothetical protein|nr:hypothetical protein [Planctomycetota bacterium]